MRKALLLMITIILVGCESAANADVNPTPDIEGTVMAKVQATLEARTTSKPTNSIASATPVPTATPIPTNTPTAVPSIAPTDVATKPPEPTSTRPQGMANTVNGTITILKSDFFVAGKEPGSCTGAEPLQGLRAGSGVDILNNDGDVLSHGTLKSGKAAGEHCVFSFQITNVPYSDVYLLSFDGYSEGNFAIDREALVQNNWSVAIEVGSNQGTNQPTSTPTAEPTDTTTPVPAKDTSKETFTINNWEPLQDIPREHVGARVDFTGSILGDPEYQDGDTVVQVTNDAVDLNVVIDYPKHIKVGNGDTVAVTGSVIDVYTGESKAGNTLVLPLVLADSFKVVMTYEDIANPKVIYKITGTAPSVDVTYANEQGGTEQKSSVSVPWSTHFRGSTGGFLYISAQNNADHGTVKCQIIINGRVVKQSESSGAYVIADCSGEVP